MPYFKENPQWEAVEIVDGYGAHVSSIIALKYHKARLVLEGDSSHINQAYDKFVAKHDKALANTSLSVLRRTTTGNKGIIDQWGLVYVGLQCICSTLPATWTSSFDTCNLDPRTRVTFVEWYKKIQPFLHASETFKVEKAEDYLFLLLPSFWHGMLQSQRKGICNLIDKK
jgi:hypothetical protein